jgi:hypothetical protein
VGHWRLNWQQSVNLPKSQLSKAPVEAAAIKAVAAGKVAFRGSFWCSPECCKASGCERLFLEAAGGVKQTEFNIYPSLIHDVAGYRGVHKNNKK